MYWAHESSYIDSGAIIGSGTKIWHFCHIMGGARIGENCTLGQNVFIAAQAILGNNVKVQNNVSVYDGVILEDFVFCGPSMTFTNVLTPRAAYPTPTESYETTLVRYGATIGANATIVCGVIIGAWAFVAAGAVITHNVPAFGLVVGVPAKLAGWICACRHKLTFVNDVSTCANCSRYFRRVSPEQIQLINSDLDSINSSS